MNKLTVSVAVAFSVLTVAAIALNSIYPEGLESTPKVEKINVRDRSVAGHTRSHSGFHHGK